MPPFELWDANVLVRTKRAFVRHGHSEAHLSGLSRPHGEVNVVLLRTKPVDLRRPGVVEAPFGPTAGWKYVSPLKGQKVNKIVGLIILTTRNSHHLGPVDQVMGEVDGEGRADVW